MVFGLYAAQLKKKVHSTPVAKIAEILPEAEKIPQTRIQIVYDLIVADRLFSNKISGIKLLPAQPPVINDFLITFSGDEMFTDDGVAIHESWNSALDFLAEIILKERGLKVEISGYAESNAKNGLAFSFSRAESLAHYFERRHGISISKTFVLRGMGPVPQGKKIELRFYFNASSGANNSGADKTSFKTSLKNSEE
jgi:outer membrane protein OmpA-like peptidoglycan-associated protein